MSSTSPAVLGVIAASITRSLRSTPAMPPGVMLALLFLTLLIAAAIAPGLFTIPTRMASGRAKPFRGLAGRTRSAPTSPAATSSPG